MLRKVKNELIKNNTLNSYEQNQVEKKKAEAASKKLKYINKPAKFIKQGIPGKKLK